MGGAITVTLSLFLRVRVFAARRYKYHFPDAPEILPSTQCRARVR